MHCFSASHLELSITIPGMYYEDLLFYINKQNHSPRRCLSASDRLDIFAVKEGMTELLFAPENVKGKGYTWQDLWTELCDSPDHC